MFSIRNLSKEFKQGNQIQKVLKGIDLEVNKGDLITIMGPSGGGKSTLLYSLALLSEPTSGEIFFQNKKVDFQNEKTLEGLRRNNIGLIFQNPNLISSLTPVENLVIVMNSKEGHKEKVRKAEELLKMVGLSDKKKASISSLSGGEAQRVAIVRALVNKPSILLCDEPTGALDSENGSNVINILLNIREETQCALVIVTHDENIGRLGERRLYLRDGVIDEIKRDSKVI
ncbi:putative ABC transport system ATP-binding protein [Clostridium cavendishii DSM 21758]|uniref:Putative ABC transport system ATP-binding protein n=1 Tax=Clostridium cavendishii DSM 21758 TaxID=1121302 RepID=A0A1M6CGP0_9CLOT|nr:ABC transporter ATP-binding protein [Clostridium cavendishii]SHI60182.1 putative ABC transport system ATP-binding protein [Clostridium cavendishii DSM 21758]